MNFCKKLFNPIFVKTFSKFVGQTSKFCPTNSKKIIIITDGLIFTRPNKKMFLKKINGSDHLYWI